ncbi:MAG: lysophospholipid acyltransferase family protein, partial [bacterium]|nr:lysophospholipid acyltransferase family protein [bacterium]
LKAINEGIELINQGFSLLVFPEGTRSHGKQQREFKKGSLRLATKPGVPVIPVTINGTYKIFEEHGALKGNQSVSVTIHEAIPTAGMSKHEQSVLSETVQTIVESALPEELRHVPATDETDGLAAAEGKAEV